MRQCMHEVSMEMHDPDMTCLSIYHKGVDWLDKPHFPFLDVGHFI